MNSFIKTAEKNKNGYIVIKGNIFNTDQMDMAEQYNLKIQNLALARIAKGQVTQKNIAIAYDL